MIDTISSITRQISYLQPNHVAQKRLYFENTKNEIRQTIITVSSHMIGNQPRSNNVEKALLHHSTYSTKDAKPTVAHP